MTRSTEPLLVLNEVSVRRGSRLALDHLDLTIHEGEHVAIIGPNGSGKSTLVKLIDRELYPASGSIRIRGRERWNVQELRSTLGIVTNDLQAAIYGEATALEVVVAGFEGKLGAFWDSVTPERTDAAQRALCLAEASHLTDRPFGELSSGEARRVMIARALAHQPTALLLDEPTTSLDPVSGRSLLATLRRLAQNGMTLVLVTHHRDEILPEFRRVVMLRDGKVAHDGPRDQTLATPEAASLFGVSTNGKDCPSGADYLRRMRAAAVYGVAVKTPLDCAPVLSERLGNRVWIKREDQQPVFSFKLRGAYTMMAKLDGPALDRGVIAASAGNHAQGVALAARRLGTQATIVVPATAPAIKQEAIRRLGAELILHGDAYDDAYAHAIELAQQTGATFVHPYDHPDVIAGQGTVGLEILDQHPGPIDAVFVPVGGGGLLAGIALAVKQLRPTTRVIGVEPEDSDAMRRSLDEGRRVTLGRVGLFADGVAVRTPGEEPFRIAQEWVDEVIVVSNDAICGAVKEIFEDRRAVLEPAGALAFAGLRAYVEREGCEHQTLVAVASGANLNFHRLRTISERADAGEGHEAIFAVTIPERPGAFRSLCAALGPRNVTEFNYRMGDPERAVVFVGVQVEDGQDRETLLTHLERERFPTLDLTHDEIAKTHVRHMVGGRSPDARHERIFHFDFPERVGALSRFLDRLGGQWNISLFHYRNHGAEQGRVLCGIEVPPETTDAFASFLEDVGYQFTEQTSSPALEMFLR